MSISLQRILVPMDFSEHTDMALITAHHLADHLGAELRLLHVVEPLRSMGISNYGHEICRNWEVSQKEAAEELMHKACDAIPLPADRRDFRTVSGRPADAIPAVAKEDGVDLIVLPTHGRSGLEQLVVGSVAERVVRNAHCPVLTLKPFGRPLAVEAR